MSIIQNNDITNHRLSEKVYTIKSNQKYVNIKPITVCKHLKYNPAE